MASPRPGQEKIVSTAIAPERTKPKLIAASVTTGQQRVRHGVAVAHGDVAQALRAREHEVVLAHRVEQRRAHHERVLAEVGERQRQRRQEHVLAPGRASCAMPASRSEVGSSMPPIGNQPSATANSDSSSIPSQKSGIEYSRHRERRRRVVGLRVAPPRGRDPDQDPEHRREDRRDADERDRRRRLVGDLRRSPARW